jgi:hypothetical protein
VPPEESKPEAVPAENRLRLDDRDGVPPAGQESGGNQESKPVETRKPWTSCMSAENDELMAK